MKEPTHSQEVSLKRLEETAKRYELRTLAIDFVAKFCNWFSKMDIDEMRKGIDEELMKAAEVDKGFSKLEDEIL